MIWLHVAGAPAPGPGRSSNLSLGPSTSLFDSRCISLCKFRHPSYHIYEAAEIIIQHTSAINLEHHRIP